MYECLNGLAPAAFFRWFGRIAAIPHGSRKEQALAAFLKDFAKERNIPCQEDATGNLLMQLPAAPGYEDQPAIVFQAHMDMIWEKAPGCDFDFETSPLNLKVEGDRLMAEGTTLGADNAVGMATMLALADDPTIPHPPLELLFTVAEEVGMLGVRGFEVSKLKARRMVNMDCGDSHVLCVCSAGKADSRLEATLPLTPIPQNFTGLRISLSGGLGGHPGLEANKSRCCCANAMGDLLTALPDFRLVSLMGSGPIMASAEAVAAVPQDAEGILRQRFADIARIYADTDPNVTLTLTPCALPATAPDGAASRRMALALSLVRTGQCRVDASDPRNTVSSHTLMRSELTGGDFLLTFRTRSTCAADQQLHFERAVNTMALLGFDLKLTDDYAGWTERKVSPFREKFFAAHRALFGYDMDIERCSGGIEVGIITSQLPDMDTVGIAPTARGAHTPQEYLQISETAPYWELVLAVLATKE